MVMKNNTLSGLDGSKVFLSEGAEEFDPDSLVEEEESQEQPLVAQSTIPLVILSLITPNKTPLFVGGYFQRIMAGLDELTIEMIGLLPVGLELVRLSTIKPGVGFNHLEIQADGGPVKIDKPNHYKVKCVCLSKPQSNNQVSIKVVLAERHI